MFIGRVKKYLVSKLKVNMTFDNYGLWEIDHIKPMSSFDFNDINEIKRCCHYTNLQPLWKHDNRVKSNKCECNELNETE